MRNRPRLRAAPRRLLKGPGCGSLGRLPPVGFPSLAAASPPRSREIHPTTPPLPLMTASPHTWKFFRTGGLDQVSLESGADLLALENLDQKLWVALSCPVKGLEIDEKSLALFDADGDGRIRVPEIITAIKWAAARLNDVGVLLTGVDGLPLSAFNTRTPEGEALLASAKNVLSSLGKADAAVITTADAGNTAAVFAGNPVRGDGVIVAAAAKSDATKTLINDIVACTGGSPDVAGGVGVTAANIDSFYADVAAYLAWISAGKDVQVLGDDTAAASAAINAVRTKVDDFFARCRLAAFDGRAVAALNRSESEYLAIAAADMKITSEEVKDFPLATIAAGKSLSLLDGVNPAWAAALSTLQQAAVGPVLGKSKSSLTESEWTELGAKLAGYDAWVAGKAGANIEPLGATRALAIAAGEGRDGLTKLLADDAAKAPAFKAIKDVCKLAYFHRDLRTLLHNFVNFADFYSREKWAMFQTGTLYLDSRSTELCIRVDGANPLAAMSKVYIAYCALTRPGGRTMTIAACFTQGDSDYLFVGRHGVFYDRAGNDWDATITSIVDNPISIRQAFWSPYKKFVRMIEERVAKRAAAAEAASDAKLASAADKTAAGKPGELPKKVDVGAVAAIGVAIAGAVSALSLILGYIFGLAWWQYPLVLVGLMLIISLPSMVLAWLKLRQRTLGPILEGNGWAVNGRVKINIPFGTALTEMAVKPPGSKLSLEDPYEDKEAKSRKRKLIWMLIILALLAAAAWVYRQDRLQHGYYRWLQDPPPPAEVPAEAPAAETAPAADAGPAATPAVN